MIAGEEGMHHGFLSDTERKIPAVKVVKFAHSFLRWLGFDKYSISFEDWQGKTAPSGKDAVCVHVISD